MSEEVEGNPALKQLHQNPWKLEDTQRKEEKNQGGLPDRNRRERSVRQNVGTAVRLDT